MPFRLYALITWTTRARADLLDQQGGRFLERFLPTIAARYGAEILACGIVADHVHVLIRLGPVVDIPGWFRDSKVPARALPTAIG